jgi:D-tyrosyl-tRNA(Tyr) deacylase
MRAVVQKVSRADVIVAGECTGEIKQGLMLLLGVTHDDTEQDARYMAEKIANLRIFEDAHAEVIGAEGAYLSRLQLDNQAAGLPID